MIMIFSQRKFEIRRKFGTQYIVWKENIVSKLLNLCTCMDFAKFRKFKTNPFHYLPKLSPGTCKFPTFTVLACISVCFYFDYTFHVPMLYIYSNECLYISIGIIHIHVPRPKHMCLQVVFSVLQRKTPYQVNLKMSWIKINERSQNSEVDAEHLKLKNQT